IWKSIKNKAITRQICTFLWKCIHSALRIGKFWRNIPECDGCEMCHKCGVTESIQHILLECTCRGQSLVWDLAKELWS
ncbi:hypothetical protein B0H11DRAFT_1636772, partial [Mycena galericulata]